MMRIEEPTIGYGESYLVKTTAGPERRGDRCVVAWCVRSIRHEPTLKRGPIPIVVL